MLSEQKLKNLINRYSKEYGLFPQQLYSLFGLEQLLMKIDKSEFKDSFVLKGGYLLSTIYGLSNRVTRDLDATIRRMDLSEQKMKEFVDFIESPDENGNQYFQLRKQNIIREKFDYDGYNLKLNFIHGKLKIPLEIDMTTGEELLPIKNQKIPLMFGEGSLQFPTYPLEQILSDKLYTTIAYGSIDDTNSRTKDLYDIYFLSKLHDDINFRQVRESMQQTFNQRQMAVPSNEYKEILTELANSPYQNRQWKNFSEEHSYAAGITFSDVMKEVKVFSDKVVKGNELSMNERLNHARDTAKNHNNLQKSPKLKNRDKEITD